MKTILYNPIFINPQAYYVFPRLTRYLQPDNESTSEPANYIGTIEVKVIAYGDTTLKRTYTNTDSIDLSEFKNTWIRISLFTKVGSCVLGEWKIGNMESDLPYIDPEVLASLKAVVIVGNKTNNDSDRAIVKNLVDASNPFVISNAAFKLNSGFGKYEISLTDSITPARGAKVTDNSIEVVDDTFISSWIYYSKMESAEINSYSIEISGMPEGKLVQYWYNNKEGVASRFDIKEDGIYTLPQSYAPADTGSNKTIGLRVQGSQSQNFVGFKVRIIPSFEGAFVTDGVNDLITSTKTVQEMLGGSNEITVVSMAHFIKGESNAPEICRINQIRRDTRSIRNSIFKIGKSGIFGYTYKNGVTTINNILGDKNDCTAEGNLDGIVAPFSVEGYYYNNNSNPLELCSIAWYWTIIANKVLTTDQINQVIAYFNLDRTLKSDIYCNIAKQGITNENHASFGDRLIDFSGNGRDIQLNNIAWKGNSGIGNYPVDFTSLTKTGRVDTITHNSISYSTGDRSYYIVYKGLSDKIDTPAFKIKIKGISLNVVYFYINSKGIRTSVVFNKDGVYELPTSYNSLYTGTEIYVSGLASDGGSGVITIIPSNAGALCLDGINDFGKVTGMPIYKDYTFIIDYERISYASSERWVAGVVSKSHVANQGAFILMTANTEVEPGKQAYSFGGVTSFNRDDFTRALLYQSKYKCGDVDLTVGEGVDSDTLWLGTFRSNDQRFFNGAIYSLMSFPYSMSEFLIERQLKKHKLGTLYPNMVEFRPVIKSNTSYDNIVFYYKNEKVENGTYLTVGSSIGMHIRLSSSPVNEIKSITVNGIPATFKFHDANNNIYQYDFNLTSKSPQKIDITIDEYIRYEDIVQPYPVLLRFKDESGKEVSWGGKFRVGSTITRIGSAADSNLLPNIYNIFGLLLNDNQVTSSKVIVEKTMIFKAKSAYIFDNNEPKVILSPSRLRIPNSSYKLLGYIPDISGHGNHGKINNSAYAEGSGVNEDGSYQFDGVDDFVTIPTTVGGKQVLMKVNWQNRTGLLYDQRKNGSSIDTFAILNVNSNNSIAYNSRNTDGETYIDGILNKNIVCPQLYKITHSITIINQLANKEEVISPTIGSDTTHKVYFSQMSLYDFMLFDNISTDDKIKELNEYVGIEGNTE